MMDAKDPTAAPAAHAAKEATNPQPVTADTVVAKLVPHLERIGFDALAEAQGLEDQAEKLALSVYRNPPDVTARGKLDGIVRRIDALNERARRYREAGELLISDPLLSPAVADRFRPVAA